MLAAEMLVRFPITACAAVAVALLYGSRPVGAQTPAEAIRVNAQRGAELALFGGGAGGAEGGGGSFGWSIGWRPSARVAIEGTGVWTSEPGIDGFAALFGPRIYLSTSGRVAPFLTVAGGLFHASVDPTAVRSSFYLDRLPPPSLEKAFNDFVAVGGGGAELHLGGRFWIRPDARVLMVVDGWRTHWFATAGCYVAFRFIERPPAP
jgi:hypothetical protein